MIIRFADRCDAAALLGIYAQYIDTPVTFEYMLPQVAEFEKRICDISGEYPYLVCEEDSHIIGYAYAHRQMERAAYGWNAELSVYLDKGCVSRGVGKRLYRALMDMLRLQGVRNVYGVVTVPNEKSERLHRSLGFSDAGIHHNTGYKCGRWHDVQWFEKQLLPHSDSPQPFVPIGKVDRGELSGILKNYSDNGKG